MSIRVRAERHVLLAGALIGVGLLGGCGGGGDTPDAKPSTSVAATTASPTREPSLVEASAKSEYGSVDPGASIGQTVRYSGFADEVCANEFYSIDDGGSSAQDLDLLEGGRLIVTCDRGHLLIDVFGGEVTWSRESTDDTDYAQDAVTSNESVFVGPDHVFVITTTQYPAVELEAAYLTREVQAFDAQTGESVWSAPLEESVPESESSATDYALHESAAATGTDIVVIEGDVFSAFAASSGEPLWSVAELTGDYKGLGISLDTSGGSWDEGTWTAYEAGTAKKLWEKVVPDVSGGDVLLEGATVWQIGQSGVIAVDLRTGAFVLNRLYPRSWDDYRRVVTPDYSLSHDGTNLQMFQTTDLRKPLWSTPSDDVSPLAVTRDLVIVEAESGLVPIDGRTGAIRQDLYLPEDASSSQWTVVDGLTLFDDGSIFELSPPTVGVVGSTTAAPNSGANSPTPAST
ncbi:MAG: PQQ-binding-like beta-propeller repeat protein [Candidatus Nanopelagicales bacterium]